MFVFVKTKTVAFPVEIDSEATVETLENKIKERFPYNRATHQIMYSGKGLTSGKLSSFGVSEESTIHLAELPSIKVLVKFEDLTKEISLPVSPPPTILQLKQQIQSAFKEKAFGGQLPDVFVNSNKLANSSLVVDSNPNNLTFEAKVQIVSQSTSPSSTDLSEAKKEELLASFVNGATSSKVEIVFSFDTTGSMSTCLENVRKEVSQTVERLAKDIKDIRIGIIAHGDYCDGPNAISVCDLTTDSAKICQFVRSVRATSGGDAPEAYELVLRDARQLSWSADSSKALVVIGDEVPHPPSYTTEKINWFDEADKLHELGVKIYGIRALNCHYAAPFYEEISERTGGIAITFKNFGLIVDMFLAICYREASPQQLTAFAEEVKDQGKMNAELGNIFQTLAQPNMTVSKEKKPSRSKAVWYEIENDTNKTPSYAWDSWKKTWVPYSPSFIASMTTTSSSSSSSASSTSFISDIVKKVWG
eukprot:TRINITY_DN2242_c0_g1_i1.p1 TRINITY_DN2242_c0_g1~~TRINITY_DN2242_c0_g1_i1.p1  ORF type:complete len:476 (+),score=127.20 TRINITY_DN2242_c0_g1_i1:87-1514(+)